VDAGLGIRARVRRGARGGGAARAPARAVADRTGLEGGGGAAAAGAGALERELRRARGRGGRERSERVRGGGGGARRARAPARPPGRRERRSAVSWREALRRWWRRLERPGAGADGDAEQLAARALAALEHALGENDAETRLQGLREALAMAEGLADPRGDQLGLEASLHRGGRLRAAGRRDEAMLHFEQAVVRSFRVADPVGRHRRAGVLSRLAILDQEAGELLRARARYREALELGRDTESQQLLGMLTQAAFNLGLLQSESGEEDQAVERWGSALALDRRAGHAGGWDPAAVAAFNLGHLHARRGDTERARRMFAAVAAVGEPSGTPLGRMACAKASLALAAMAEREGLLGGPEA